jgi:very-short-patch-repair endonuclease
MTPQERHLWYDFLRYCKPRFRRQEIVGPYIADFICYDAKLIVEVDGSQHFSPETIAHDNARTAYFHSLGIRVMRVDNGEVNRNFSGVCEGIMEAMKQCGTEPVLNIEG